MTRRKRFHLIALCEMLRRSHLYGYDLRAAFVARNTHKRKAWQP